MFVNDCMTRHPILLAPTALASEAESIMAENRIRHIPVVKDGKRLEGLLTRSRLRLRADSVGSLNIWEISRHLSELPARDVMIRRKGVHTVTADVTIEWASRLMMEHKIGCLPVLDDDDTVIGIITEVDILAAFQEMLGLPSGGVRVTLRIPDQPGAFNQVMAVVASRNWSVLGLGTFPSRRHPGFYDLVLKLPRVSQQEVQQALEALPDQKIVDIRSIS